MRGDAPLPEAVDSLGLDGRTGSTTRSAATSYRCSAACPRKGYQLNGEHALTHRAGSRCRPPELELSKKAGR